MFPKDVIANAPRIISDLRAFFPPRGGHLPDRADGQAGLGHADAGQRRPRRHHRDSRQHRHPRRAAASRCRPTTSPIIRLQVLFVGAIEFDKKRLFFFAALFESRVAFLTIEGEMGLLVAWGDDAQLRAVSVGGFHPQFAPPPLPFPSPKRIADQPAQHAGVAGPRRGLLRRHLQHGAVRRAGRRLLRPRRASASTDTCSSTRCSSSRRSASSSRSRRRSR